MEQLNIEGKRSGEGFVAHKAILVNALSRALADRVTLMDINVGRKGFLTYLKALDGSNVVKIVPSNGSASESQTDGSKGLKVICGANTSVLNEGDWLTDKTPLAFCEIRVSPSNSVKPNVGASELAELLAKVIPFTATDDNRPVLQCVKLAANEGKITLASADGFRLAVTSIEADGVEGEALISGEELNGVISALKRAKRARVSIESGGEQLTSTRLIIDTELIRYKWVSADGNFPEYEKLIPTEFNTVAHFDTLKAIKAVNAVNTLPHEKAYPVDLTIGNGKIIMSNADGKGEVEINADVEGEVKVRVDGKYLAQALKAFGGMVDLKLTNGYSPMLFTSNGYQLVVMPMLTEEANKQAEAEKEARLAEQEPAEPTEPAVAKAEHKPKRNRKKAVAVA